MSQVKWVKGPRCGTDNCRSRLWRLEAGRKLCQYGHVMENSNEFGEDDSSDFVLTRRLEVQIKDTAFGAAASQSQSQVSQVKRSRRLHGKEGVKVLRQALQVMLRKVAPLIIWEQCRDVPNYNDFESDAMNLVKLYWTRWLVTHVGRFAVMDIYVIVYLALRTLNMHPVYLDSYVDMLNTNKVPYYDVRKFVPRELIEAQSVIGMLTPHYIPINSRFANRLLTVCFQLNPDVLHWGLHPDHFLPNAYSVFADLQLPLQLVVLYARIAPFVRPKNFKLTRPLVLPEVVVVGLYMVVIKLYFAASPKIVDPKEWVPWLQNQCRHPFKHDESHRLDWNVLLDLTEDETHDYLNWVNGNVVPDVLTALERYENKAMEEKLLLIFPRKEYPTLTVHAPHLPRRFDTVDNYGTDFAEMEQHLFQYLARRFGLAPRDVVDSFRQMEYAVHQTLRREAKAKMREERGGPNEEREVTTDAQELYDEGAHEDEADFEGKDEAAESEESDLKFAGVVEDEDDADFWS